MKRVNNNVLHTPTNVNDIVYEDYLQDYQANTKASRSAVKAHRRLKHQLN